MSLKRIAEIPKRKAVREAVFERDGYQCVLYGWGLDMHDQNLTFHHRRKASAGGAYTVVNGLTLCSLCNGRVEDEPEIYRQRWDTWLVVREGDREYESLGVSAPPVNTEPTP